MRRLTSRSVRYSRPRLPTVTFTEVGAASRSREFSMETALPPVQICPFFGQFEHRKKSQQAVTVSGIRFPHGVDQDRALPASELLQQSTASQIQIATPSQTAVAE